jgi:peptidyl-prolyl cis-trans isomerase C
VALVINGELIPDRTLNRELLRLSSGLEMDAPRAGAIEPAQLRSAALQNVIERTLLLQMAKHREMTVSEADVQAELIRRWGVERSSACDPGAMAGIREDLLVQRLQTELTRHVPRPNRSEVDQFYRSNLDRYRVPEAVEAAHILCGYTSDEEEESALRTIEHAQAKLECGMPFAKVADLFSDCKGVGGSVGWVVRGTMVPEFEEVVFSLAPNQTSPIFRTVFGFHIATVRRRRVQGVVPLQQVKLAIAKSMHDQARLASVQQVMARLRAESSIHYTEDRSHG